MRNIMHSFLPHVTGGALVALLATGCGSASFGGQTASELTGASRGANSSDATATPDPEALPASYTAAHPLSGSGSGTNANGSGTASTGNTGGTSTAGAGKTTTTTTTSTGTTSTTSGSGGTSVTTSSTPPNIPGADPSDIPAIEKCLASWPGSPFSGSQPIQNYKKIYAAVSVLGIGNAIDDTETTPQPELIVVDAGVNVLGSPTYSLLNHNGYYCMIVNVNVLTSLTIDLDCGARLADSRVNVNVLSSQNSPTSAVGVNVLSGVTVTTVRPQGESCIR